MLIHMDRHHITTFAQEEHAYICLAAHKITDMTNSHHLALVTYLCNVFQAHDSTSAHTHVVPVKA